VPQYDDEQTESGYTVRVDYDRAVEAGASKLGAVSVGTHWYYKADETDEIYRLTRREVAELGAGQLDDRGVDYSLWCSGTGRLIKRPTKAVLAALGIED
jgi:hypothetical protein